MNKVCQLFKIKYLIIQGSVITELKFAKNDIAKFKF